MTVNRWRNRSAMRRGTVITQAVVFGSLVGVGVAAITVDTGLMFAAKQELQSAADSAALAAASQLAASTHASQAAMSEAATFAALNKIAGSPGQMLNADLVIGHAQLNASTAKYDFFAGQTPNDAVQVTLRRDQQVTDGPVSLVFGRMLGVNGAKMTSKAVAMVAPRDISVTVDLSGSMNDDSEFRHYKPYTSENGGSRPGVKNNLEDVWRSIDCTKGNEGVGNGIDPQPPGQPNSDNDQPGTGPGHPQNQGGNPSPGANPTGPNGDCGGPRWGWMTGFGNAITLGSYTPVGDPGFYYIPKNATTTDADVVANIAESGYSTAERSALLDGSHDATQNSYRNRVKCLLGLAGWNSRKPGGKYTKPQGNADNTVDNNELVQQVNFPYTGGSWDAYIDYVSGASEMTDTDPNFRYRYGLKTVTNYFLERLAQHTKCNDLQSAPEMPLKAVKDATQTLIDTINELQADDHVSLEIFATTGRHEVDLVTPDPGVSLASVIQAVPDKLKHRQAGHYDSLTNAGAGLDTATAELTSSRARPLAAKVIIFLSDGKPSVAQNGAYVGVGGTAAVNWAVDRAHDARSHGATIFTIGVGGDADAGFMQQIAQIGIGEYYFADSATDPATGQPMYVTQLTQIFQTIGGKRPVRLIK